MKSREEWEIDGTINSKFVGKWERSTRKEKFDNAGERGGTSGAMSSNGQENIRPSAQIGSWPLLGVRPRETGIDAGRWLYMEMGVCGNYHLSAYIFLVTLEASSWAQS